MSISKIFIPNFVFVLTMKDTKHIRRDFYSVAWVMPQGWDFGALGYPGGQIKIFQTWSCSISNRRGFILNLNGYRCCHIYNLMHDVKTAMLHYLEISTEICVVL